MIGLLTELLSVCMAFTLLTIVMCRSECCSCFHATPCSLVTTSVPVLAMLWLTMVLSAAGPSDVIDPCHPPSPCKGNSNMSDPYGDCAFFYECQPSHQLWQRMQCDLQNNETTYYDSVTGLCLLSSLQPTCHEQCSGKSISSISIIPVRIR